LTDISRRLKKTRALEIGAPGGNFNIPVGKAAMSVGALPQRHPFARREFE